MMEGTQPVEVGPIPEQREVAAMREAMVHLGCPRGPSLPLALNTEGLGTEDLAAIGEPAGRGVEPPHLGVRPWAIHPWRARMRWAAASPCNQGWTAWLRTGVQRG